MFKLAYQSKYLIMIKNKEHFPVTKDYEQLKLITGFRTLKSSSYRLKIY